MPLEQNPARSLDVHTECTLQRATRFRLRIVSQAFWDSFERAILESDSREEEDLEDLKDREIRRPS